MLKMLWRRLFLLGQSIQDRSPLPQGTKTLSDSVCGEMVRIESLKGEDAVCQRLREMGFCESAVVQKISQNGALICRVYNSRVAISQSLASNIIVRNNNAVLSQLSVGQKARICNFLIESEDCERIEEMGLTPGECVEIVRYAPLGDPIEIKIRGYLLSLRKEEAQLIQVEVLS